MAEKSDVKLNVPPALWWRFFFSVPLAAYAVLALALPWFPAGQLPDWVAAFCPVSAGWLAALCALTAWRLIDLPVVAAA